jgi:lactobin A/cerein 7B family class IIb bacteriocin
MNQSIAKQQNEYSLNASNALSKPSKNLRELSDAELAMVAGGFGPLEGFNWGAAVGTVGGAVITGATFGATRGGVIGGALGFSFGAGYGLGTIIADFFYEDAQA